MTDIPESLREGYRRFRAGRFAEEAGRYAALAEGQAPATMIIGCADSRVDPATIFSAGPGELFVVRNVAALVPPHEETGTYHGTSAALEFAVTVLGVRTVLVLGHGLCGGITAALASEERSVGRFITPWVDLLSETRDAMLARLGDADPDTRQRALEHLAVRLSLENLMSFPFVRERVEAGDLRLEGAWFSIAAGELMWLDQATEEFVRLGE